MRSYELSLSWMGSTDMFQNMVWRRMVVFALKEEAIKLLGFVSMTSVHDELAALTISET
jgi:hypothetical protein